MSEKLRLKFFLLETAMFVEWQKANKKDRDRICKEIGELEGKWLLAEINELAAKLK